MADKKFTTYDCFLSFSFQTKEDDFMNPDFNFDHIRIVLDALEGPSVTFFGDFGVKHPIISSDVQNSFFSCSPVQLVDLTAEDLLKSTLCHQDLESLGGCVFCYQPIKGSRFWLGVKEKVFENGLSQKNEKELVSEKFPKRSRSKKS